MASQADISLSSFLPLSFWAQTPSEPGKLWERPSGAPISFTLLVVMCRNLFQLLFGQSIPLEPFPVLDTTNYHHCSHGQNQQSHNPCERDEVISQGEAIVWDQKHPSPVERNTSIRGTGKAKGQKKNDKVIGS